MAKQKQTIFALALASIHIVKASRVDHVCLFFVMR